MEHDLAVLQAVLFASGDPVDKTKLAAAAQIDVKQIDSKIQLLEKELENSALQILHLGNGFQLATRKEFHSYIKTALEVKKNTPLSQAAMEALTIVAYNQPVTKSFVEEVRGVDSSGVINSLVEKELLCEAGRLELPGRPIAYRTTDNFLRSFQISSLEQLPAIKNISEQVTIEDIIEDKD